MYTLKRGCIVNTTLEAAWAFISRPENLNRITPADMEFRILSDVPREMYDGLLIRYRVRIPFLGTRDWLTEIKHIRERRSFVDEQRRGPYRLWYHYHEITGVPAGVRFVDEVTYVLPFGLLGRLVHALFVRRTLDRIFRYRNEQLIRLLGNDNASHRTAS